MLEGKYDVAVLIYKPMKSILVDAWYNLLLKMGMNHDLEKKLLDLLFPNHKIILTMQPTMMYSYGMSICLMSFSLEHNPNKTDKAY